ncbi:UNVERIFIED_CONTAM: hypothetical protein GTU68_046249 [Idotea baltica]|nr:hypothetical protein [Idotea baltica]
MVVRRESGTIQHLSISDLPDLLCSNDRLILNNTKVVPARLFQNAESQWQITGQTRGKLTAGESITLIPAAESDKALDEISLTSPNQRLVLKEKQADGTWLVEPDPAGSSAEILEAFGTLPLPPYIGRKVADQSDQDRYQTVYASKEGAIAAPTAGLHFTDELLGKCRSKGVQTTDVTLHVGIGTFRPVNADRLSDHQMHSEWCEVPASAFAEIQATKQADGNIVCVGTTSVRTLEAAALCTTTDHWAGDTELFIQPGFQFRLVDQLLTNFHLPGSTLIVLVAALAGYELTMEAYAKAVEEKYRFYSYGDAMLIL